MNNKSFYVAHANLVAWMTVLCLATWDTCKKERPIYSTLMHKINIEAEGYSFSLDEAEQLWSTHFDANRRLKLPRFWEKVISKAVRERWKIWCGFISKYWQIGWKSLKSIVEEKLWMTRETVKQHCCRVCQRIWWNFIVKSLFSESHF